MPPGATLAVAGERVSEAIAGGVTVTGVVAVTVVPVTAAVTLVVPAVTPVANPVAPTMESTAGFSEVQEEIAVTSPVVPLLYVAVALN